MEENKTMEAKLQKTLRDRTDSELFLYGLQQFFTSGC